MLLPKPFEEKCRGPAPWRGVICLLQLCHPDVPTNCRSAPPQSALASWKPSFTDDALPCEGGVEGLPRAPPPDKK
ncbi:unnamed protein product [Lota lota]